ncbi:MAG: restriction endonuclease subunit S [Chloroflexota bacterium]|nr:restriction endonuclease subunit S [Chloroflexota bacterium]
MDHSQADTQYIAAFMRSPIYLERAPIDTTPGQLPRIRLEEVAAVEVALPPIEEQQRIVQRLEVASAEIESIRAAARKQRETVEALPAALLHEIFGRWQRS